MEVATVTPPESIVGSSCRAVTADEVAHYNEFGWVKLKGFVRRETVKFVLNRGYELLGLDGDSNPVLGLLPNGQTRYISYFNAVDGDGLAIPEMRDLIVESAKAAKSLIHRIRPVDIKYFGDTYFPKLPSGKVTKHAGNGPTTFHQDYINFSVDRSGGMTVWLALEDYGPESGTMSFVSGSHRLGVLGNYRSFQNGEDLLDIYPNLRDELTEPMSYAAGDVTVHSHMTAHGASQNITDRPRWAYAMIFQPADACWSGAPAEAYDHTICTIYRPLPEERFPILA